MLRQHDGKGASTRDRLKENRTGENQPACGRLRRPSHR
jgi:hypothetical protein